MADEYLKTRRSSDKLKLVHRTPHSLTDLSGDQYCFCQTSIVYTSSYPSLRALRLIYNRSTLLQDSCWAQKALKFFIKLELFKNLVMKRSALLALQDIYLLIMAAKYSLIVNIAEILASILRLLKLHFSQVIALIKGSAHSCYVQ
jgi:hypothetical protein